ncbi:hypothetical protein LXL04_012072 [Taraxacum kok-saghyz]
MNSFLLDLTAKEEEESCLAAIHKSFDFKFSITLFSPKPSSKDERCRCLRICRRIDGTNLMIAIDELFTEADQERL